MRSTAQDRILHANTPGGPPMFRPGLVAPTPRVTAAHAGPPSLTWSTLSD
jgi:hypothetical protein